MRSFVTRTLGPVGLVGASIGLCLLGATLAFYHPSIQWIGANAESRLTVDYSAEEGTPRLARISAAIVAAARADEAGLTVSGPDDGAPFVSVVRPAPTSAGTGPNDTGPTTTPQPPTRTVAPAPSPTPTPPSGTAIEVPTGEIPGRPGGTDEPEPEPKDTATPTPITPVATPSPTATATVPTPTVTSAPSPTGTASPSATLPPDPTKRGSPKPTKTPGPKKTPPGK